MATGFRPEGFVRELEALASVKKPWAIIGGMAAIIWADRFLPPGEVRALGGGRPLVSKDLDIRGSLAHVDAIRAAWPGLEQQPFKFKQDGRIVWALASHPKGHPDRRVIEVTEKVPGIGPLSFSLAVKLRVGLHVRVLDPISCLLTKVDVLEREIARNVDGTRNDALHVRLLTRVVPGFLQFLADSKHQRWAADVERSVPILARAEQVLSAFEAATTEADSDDMGPVP